MKGLVVLLVGDILGTEFMKRDIFNRVKAAKTTEEKLAIVRETEKITLDVLLNDFFKSDEEIEKTEPKGLEAKRQFLETTLGHNYKFFNLPNPLENGVTLEEIKQRNGYGYEKPEMVM